MAVNHFWQLCFGEGLVRTPEDFGSQGKRPSHPKLLDWLSADFMANDWNVKRLLKQIVMSATYRQSSHTRPALESADPENQLLARAPRYRLTAEMIRDNALDASGLISTRMGGGGSKPYDLTESFKPMGHDKGRGFGAAQRVHVLETNRPGPGDDGARRQQTGRLSGQARDHRHPTAGVGADERPAVRRGRAHARRGHGVEHGDNIQSIIRETFRTLTSREPSGPGCAAEKAA